MANIKERIVGEREERGMIEFSVGEIPDINDYPSSQINVDDIPVCRKNTD